jgi:cytochrome b561
MEGYTVKMRNSGERYGLVARALHWSIGLLIIAQLTLGFWTWEFMERDAMRSANISLHRALGVVLLILVLARIAWRAYDPPPELPATMDAQERTGARLGHMLLYILMLAMPILGLLVSDTGGRPTDVFGLFQVPLMVGENEDLHEFFEDAHKLGAYALGLLIVLHLSAAVLHRFIRKDGVAERML